MKRMLAERELTLEGPVGRTAQRNRRSVTVNLAESPLTWLLARGHLSDRQFDACERLRADWERAQLSPSVTMSWDLVCIKGSNADLGLNQAERQIAAKQRFIGAVDQAGPGLSDILWRVACAGEALSDAERELDWPKRSGKLVLKLALDRVAEYYRIE
ncbi:MAG: DUF6456 domain-containing protein [Novosphingobium sp.]|nr:DUF6456 domain-containing protein [Novosphingobium sp.]